MTMLPFGQVAPLQRRAVAYVIDAVIAFAVSVVVPTVVAIVIAIVGRDVLAAAMIALPLFAGLGIGWLIVYTVMQAGTGSIGMRAQRVRLGSLSDGAPIGFGRALLRNVIWGLASGVVVGYFTPLFDGTGRFQGWHDKVAGAVVLDTTVTGPSTAAAVSLPAPPAPTAPSPAGLSSSAPQGAAPAFPVAPSFPAPPVAPSLQFPPAPSAPAPRTPEPIPDLPDETVLSPRDALPGPLPGDPLISFVPGVTQPPSTPPPAPARPDLPTPHPESPAAPVAPAPSDAPASADPAVAGLLDDGDEDIEQTRISIPGHRLVFRWDDGQKTSVSGRTVFGRNPEPEAGAVVVSVRDETLSLSKTHFEAAAASSGGWVMDRHSTNGTVLVRDGARIACPPGQRVPVRLGDVLEIGDRIVTIGGYA